MRNLKRLVATLLAAVFVLLGGAGYASAGDGPGTREGTPQNTVAMTHD